MRVRLIVNAAATGVRGPVLDAVIAALRDAAELEVVTTEYAGHATELAAAATEDAVVGLGGDGTYNEIANGLRPGALMGVLPAGASSVFARHLGFATDPAVAARELAAALRVGSNRAIGLGVADGRMFTFAAGLGLDAEATASSTASGTSGRATSGPGDLQVLATALRVLRAEGFALHERMTLRHGRRRLAPVLVRGRRQPAPVHLPRPDPRAGRAAGRLRARPRRGLHPRAAHARAVAPARLRR